MMQKQVMERIQKGLCPNKAELYAAVSRKIPDIRRTLKEKCEKAFQSFASLGEKTSVEELQQLERFRTAAEAARQSLEGSEKVLKDIKTKASLCQPLVTNVMSWMRALNGVIRLRPRTYRSPFYHVVFEVIERVCKEFAEEDPSWENYDKMKPKLLREIFHTACIGLVPTDHPLFAFLLAVEQEKLEGRISENAWKAFLSSADAKQDNFGVDKMFAWTTHEEWNGIMTLVNVCPDPFETLVEDIAVEEEAWKKYLSRGVRMADFPKAVMEGPDGVAHSWSDESPEPGRCREMAPFLRLLLWISLRPEWALKELENFVSRVLGPDFVHPLILTRYEEVIRACSKKSIEVVVVSDGAWTIPPELSKMISSERLSTMSRGEIEEREKICFAIFSTLPRPEFSSNLRHILHRAENLLILRQPPHCDQIQSEEEQKKCSAILEKLALAHAALLERQKYGIGAWHKKFLPFSESDFRQAVESCFQLVNELAGQAFSWKPFHRVIGAMIYGSHMASTSDERIVCTYLEQVFDEFGLSGEHSAALIHEVVRPDRSMGTLLGLCEQEDIDRLRREGKRFLTEVATLSSDTHSKASDPAVDILAEEILERLPTPLIIRSPEQKAPAMEGPAIPTRKRSTVVQGARDSPAGSDSGPECRTESSLKSPGSENVGETGGAEKDTRDSGKQQEADAKNDDEEARKATEPNGQADAEAGRSSSADNRASSSPQPQTTSPAEEASLVTAASPKIAEILEEPHDFPIKEFWDAEVEAMNSVVVAVKKELQLAGRLNENFIRRHARDFQQALLANSDSGALPIGDIVDKWLVLLQKKHRKCDEWVKEQRVSIVQLGLMKRPGLFLIAYLREQCFDQDFPLHDQEIILAPTDYQERRDIPPEELERETFIEGLYLEGAAWDWKEQCLVSPSTEQNFSVELPLLKISLRSRSDTTSAIHEEGTIQVPVHLLPRAALVGEEDRDPICFAHFPSPLSELRWSLKAVSITTFR